MTAMQRLLIPLIAATLLTACVGPNLVRSHGPVVEKRYPLEAIERASFAGNGEVRIVPSNESVLVIAAAQNVHNALEIEAEPDRLAVGPYRGLRLTHSARPVYTLYLNRLERLDLSGAMKVHADRLEGDELTLAASGSVDGELGVAVQALTVRGSGSVDLTLTGQTETLDVRGSGSVKVDAGDLLARQVELHLSGSSNITVWADEQLEVRSSGSTRVGYRGQPRVSQSVSGSSSIEALGE